MLIRDRATVLPSRLNSAILLLSMSNNDTPYNMADWIRRATLALSSRPRSLAIFGSFATENWRQAHDVDLLIVGDSIPRRPSERSAYIQPVVSEWRRKVAQERLPVPPTLSPLFLSEQGWVGSFGLRLSLSEKSWILWDDGFLSDSLEEARKWRSDGKWRKQPIPSGGFFWIPVRGAA